VSEFGQNSFISGWVVLMLSEGVRQGAELRADQTFTV
jgi:hypothetical protein